MTPASVILTTALAVDPNSQFVATSACSALAAEHVDPEELRWQLEWDRRNIED